MANKRSKAAPADDEFGELFEGLGDDKAIKKTTTKAKPTAAKTKPDATAEQDILAELESELVEKAPSRPHTPRVREAAPKPSAAKRASTETPPPRADTSRKSVESTRSHQASATPSATSSESYEAPKKAQGAQAAAGGGGGGGGSWWGGLLSTATAAMKQAEAAVKEIQQNEEAKKWADQVRGNVGALRGLGDELRHRALPTFTNILHTLAPPISSHERLLIHISHDLVGYPSLDPLIYSVFSRVMAQVEGGDLMVVQRGHEQTQTQQKRTGTASGWRDGPWWRQADDVPRDLGTVHGLVEGTKLCRANAEGYAADFFAAHGGVEAAKRRAHEIVSEANPVRSSDLFLSVQAINVPAEKEKDRVLFAGSTAEEKEKAAGKEDDDDDDDDDEDEVCFAVFILDPVHEIQYATVSQRVPARWIRWLDTPATPLTPASGDEEFQAEFGRVPEEIREIIESGGVDPREWVAEWVEEALGLAVGVVAQRYVARRMGVGEGGIGKAKQKVESVLESGGNEAARAGLI
ncbi:maintenance of telomere capping protein 1 [Chaetomium strumarium]|uniref:Maintenance of telomere capping protein 1 n=1 Tax=Chaetomium strumarium TaxID=1170767 RepID=A0AAJ0H0P5_9PEZI|nr:maintenance of telomere capping protein 1 [Chaetomium strumarium]